MVKAHAATHIGNRETNQDSFCCRTDADVGLYAVADGMGGHAEGTYAAQLVIDALAAAWDSGVLQTATAAQATDTFFSIFKQTNAEILGFSESKGIICGTTCSVLFVAGDSFCVAHVGDSRVYSIASRFLFGRVMVKLTPEHLSKKNRLTSTLGVAKKYSVFTLHGQLSSINGFVLCSDGLYKPLPDKEIKKIVTKAKSTTRAAEELITKAVEQGATDNITAIVVRV